MTNLLFRLCVIAPLLLTNTLLTAQSSRKIKLTPVSLGFDLPDSYKQRTFIKGLAGFVHKIDQLAGTMVLVDGNTPDLYGKTNLRWLPLPLPT